MKREMFHDNVWGRGHGFDVDTGGGFVDLEALVVCCSDKEGLHGDVEVIAVVLAVVDGQIFAGITKETFRDLASTDSGPVMSSRGETVRDDLESVFVERLHG